MSRRLALLLAFALAAFSLPFAGAGEPYPPSLAMAGLDEPDEPPAIGEPGPQDSLDPAFKSLLERVEELERAEQKRAESERKKKASDAQAPDDAWIDLSTEKWNVKFGGHIQLDYIVWPDSSPSIPDAVNYFEFRRLRLVADGTGYGNCDFRLQLTLEPETVGTNPPGIVTSPDVKDAYFSMNEIPWLGRFRIGNFFVPFGLEQVTNDRHTVFLERSIPTQGVFTADREVGMAFYNCTEDQNLTWTYGVFFDNISEALKERLDSNQGARVSGRVTWLPYYDEPSKGRYMVHTGAGVLYTHDQDNRTRFRARPQIHEGPFIIDSGNLAANAFTSGNLELAVVWGSVCLQSEAYLCNVNMIDGPSQTIGGAYVYLSWFLTGENRNYERFGQHGAQFGRATPYSNFFLVPGGSSLGAWEFKARWSNLTLDAFDRGQYNDLTIGFNWHWSDRARVVLDWIHPLTSSEAVFGATKSDIIGMRFDVDW